MNYLSVIMPVYNEDEVITKVITGWILELRRLKLDFELCIYNDGSTDKTLEQIRNNERIYEEIKVIHKPNTGHGPTILQGYRESQGDWIFQTDSDNEIKPDQFEKVWIQHGNGDFIIGKRVDRESPPIRKIVSFFSRWSIQLFYGRGVSDVNCPYRLFKKEKFKSFFNRIPTDTFAPNVILSGITCYEKMDIVEVPVNFSPRSTGEISSTLQKWKLLKVAVICWWQTISFRIRAL